MRRRMERTPPASCEHFRCAVPPRPAAAAPKRQPFTLAQDKLANQAYESTRRGAAAAASARPRCGRGRTRPREPGG